jgi:tetratricopeptide (TPR) repeat protein
MNSPPPERNRRFNENSEAQENLEEAIGVLMELVAQDPLPEYKYLLARCYMGLVWTDPRQRRTYTDQAKVLLEALVRDNPGVGEYRFELAIAYTLSVGRRVGDAPEDAELARKVVEILDRLTMSQPSVAHYAKVRFFSLLRLGATLEAVAQKSNDAKPLQEETASVLSRAEDARQAYAERFPEEAKRELLKFLDLRLMLANRLARVDSTDKAIKIYQGIVAELKDYLNQEPAVTSVGPSRLEMLTARRTQYATQFELSRLLHQTGAKAQEDSLLQSTATGLRQLISEFRQLHSETNSTYERAMLRRESYEAQSLNVLILEEQGNEAEADQLRVQAAMELVDDFERERQQGDSNELDVAGARLELAKAYEASGRHEESQNVLVELRSAVEMFRSTLSGDRRHDQRFRVNSAMILMRILDELGETAAAKALEDELPPFMRGGRGGRGRNRGRHQ